MESIAQYLYRIRNKYTHECRRAHFVNSLSLSQVQVITERDEKKTKIKNNFNLVNAVIDIAKERVIKIFHLEKYI